MHYTILLIFVKIQIFPLCELLKKRQNDKIQKGEISDGEGEIERKKKESKLSPRFLLEQLIVPLLSW